MVRRKLITGARAILGRVTSAQAPVVSTASSVQHQHLITPEQSRNNLKYIDERVNNVFNIILADINSKHNPHPALATAGSTSISSSASAANNVIYKDPYHFKDRILQDLLAKSDINQNYNIHDLIEDEFQLEISDHEFQQFKSLKDVVKYVNQRLEIKSMFPYDSGHSNTNLTY